MKSERTFGLTLLCGERRLAVGQGSPYLLLAQQGLFEDALLIETAPRASGYGEAVIGSRREARRIELTLSCSLHASEEQERGLSEFFRAGEAGRLCVKRDGEEREIDYLTERVTLSRQSAIAPLCASVRLLCPDPFFYGEERQGSFQEQIPLFGFPFLSVWGKGISGGLRERISFLYLENDGILPVGIRATLLVAEEGAIDPYLSLNGQRITVEGSFRAGDRIEICTLPGEKQVTVNQREAQISRESVFPQARCGTNLLMAGCRGGARIEGSVRIRSVYGQG